MPLEVPPFEREDRASLAARQGRRLRHLLAAISDRNAFYTHKLHAAGIALDTLKLPDDLARLPLTTKAELVADQRDSPPWGTALSEPIGQYTRYNQTSSTTGTPLRWLDTNQTWQWMLECWKAVYRAARVGAGDRILFPFSFGPFLGFWTGFEAGCQIGAHCIPAGGMSTEARLAMIEALKPTVMCCTPTYALRLIEVAGAEIPSPAGRDLSTSSLRVLIVAGEPGGSIPATRDRIQSAWGARVIDHHGLTEVGPISFECWEAPGHLHLNESEYICEVLEPGSDRPVPDGRQGELVVTNLGRAASPVVRYRTGDVVVRRSDPCPCGRTLARLDGGILARADDMISVRGVNVYPGAIEAIVRRFEEIIEYRVTLTTSAALRALSLEIELAAGSRDAPAMPKRVAAVLRESLGLTVPVRVASAGSLPRFEMKAHRVIVEE